MIELGIKISEVFLSCQGEGSHIGRPAVFVRTSGCTRQCKFCDSKYSKDGTTMSLDHLARKIRGYRCNTIVISGGEPLLWYEQLCGLKCILSGKAGHTTNHRFYHLESNGDLIKSGKVSVTGLFSTFDYVCFSPKDFNVARYLYKDQTVTSMISNGKCSIKVVTDMRDTGICMLPFCSMVMPLTTYDPVKDLEIKKKVWKYCMDNSIRYSPRLHVDIFGMQRGV